MNETSLAFPISADTGFYPKTIPAHRPDQESLSLAILEIRHHLSRSPPRCIWKPSVIGQLAQNTYELGSSNCINRNRRFIQK